jgi:hypothetical protein
MPSATMFPTANAMAVSEVNAFNSNELAQVLMTSDEHPSIEVIREVLNEYELQSPAHLELRLVVHQTASTPGSNEQTNTSPAVINVIFQGCTVGGHLKIPSQCRVVLRRGCSRHKARSWECTDIIQDQTIEVLKQFLNSKFPVIDAPLKYDTMRLWWSANRKVFNWAGLPTELKQRIIEFCMHQPYSHGFYSEKLKHYHRQYQPNSMSQVIGPFEIIEQLGDSYELLYVSHQVRAITLRLCINGGSSLTCSRGLCITTSSYRQLANCIDRLGNYYQMIEPDSVPTTTKAEALAKCYSRFPRIYPHLGHYATFRHGIQKINLGMDFLSCLHFFKVKIGGFQRFQHPLRLTYHIFERLPALNEIVIRLPLRPHGGWKDNQWSRGPQLFHNDAPCPRSLHRVIYERIAKVLASYNNITVRNFIDEDEEQRFNTARLEAINALKFTNKDLEELYADDGGGVEVPDEVERVKEVRKIRRDSLKYSHTDDLYDEFFPPECQCTEACALSPVLGSSRHR